MEGDWVGSSTVFGTQADWIGSSLYRTGYLARPCSTIVQKKMKLIKAHLVIRAWRFSMHVAGTFKGLTISLRLELNNKQSRYFMLYMYIWY